MTSLDIRLVVLAAVERSQQPNPTPNGAFGKGTMRQLCYEELVRLLPLRPEREFESNVIALPGMELPEPPLLPRELPAEWCAVMSQIWPDAWPQDLVMFDTTELPWRMAGEIERMIARIA